MRAYGLHNQAVALSIPNLAALGAKLRRFDPGSTEHWRACEQRLEGSGYFERRLGASALIILPLNSMLVWRYYQSQAQFAAARVLLSAERFPSAKGRWPENLAEVVPAYLPEIPRGPYSDNAVRFIRQDDGVIVDAIGIDGEDNDGRLPPEGKREPKYDVGGHLWNPKLRHRPAAISPSAGALLDTL
jgi:hypothetical protein